MCNKALKATGTNMNSWYYRGHHGFVIAELVKMRLMIERVLTILDDEVASADVRFCTQRHAVSDEDDPLLDSAREDLWISRSVIPRHVMNSLFTSLFAMFEDEMVTVCEMVGKKAGGAKDFIYFKNGIGLTKVKNYFNKHFNLDIGTYTIWQEILDTKDLRNMIAHNNGRFETRDPDAAARLTKYIEACEWLSINDTSHIVIDRNYYTHVDRSLRAFMKEFFSELETRKLL